MVVPIEGSEKRRFFAVLHQGPVRSPLDVVRAAIVAKQRLKQTEARGIRTPNIPFDKRTPLPLGYRRTVEQHRNAASGAYESPTQTSTKFKLGQVPLSAQCAGAVAFFPAAGDLVIATGGFIDAACDGRYLATMAGSSWAIAVSGNRDQVSSLPNSEIPR